MMKLYCNCVIVTVVDNDKNISAMEPTSKLPISFKVIPKRLLDMVNYLLEDNGVRCLKRHFVDLLKDIIDNYVFIIIMTFFFHQ